MTTPRFDAAAMRWLLTPDDWTRLEADLCTARAVALDTETTGLHPRGGDGMPPALVMISLTLDAPGDPSWVIPLQHSESPWSGRWRSVARRVCTLLTDRGLAVAGHNLAFDLTWLEAHAGVDLSPLSRWDTMIAARLIDEDRSARLKDVAPRLFGVEAWDDFPLTKPGAALRVPLTDLGRYACIAEGQPVLTDRGEVPIEQVTLADRVWDGVEWVHHDGLINKGMQPVIELYNGLTGTPDHLVLTTKGDYACLASIKDGARRPAALTDAAATGGLPDPDRAGLAGEASPDHRGAVRPLPAGLREAGQRLAERQARVLLPVGQQVRGRPEGEGASGTVARDAATVHPGRGDLSESWRPGRRGPVQHLRGVREVDTGQPAPRDLPGDDDRSDRQRWSLRAGKPPAGHVPGAGEQHAVQRTCGVHGPTGCPAPLVAPDQARPPRVPAQPLGGDPGTAAGPISGLGPLPHRRVYDLLNAGPRHRFSVSGTVVSNCEDTHYTLAIWRWQRDHLFLPSSGQTPANRLEAGQERLGRLASVVAMPALRTLSRVQQYGIGIDTGWCRDGLADKGEEVERLTKELTDLYPVEGEPSFAPTSTWFLAWTEEAVKAGDLQVTATTSRGRPQWSKDVLRRQAQHGSRVAADLLELRTLVKHREYLTSWLALEAHGRLYPKFNIGRTVSGRLSSSDPNLQQVTRALKPAFVPAPGHLIAEVDLSQIELRIAAFISRDEAMMAAYREGRDLHRLTASRVLGKPEAEVTPADRQKAKAVGFGFLYGMGAAKFRFYAEAMYGVTLTDEEAVEWRSRFFEGYPRLSEWHQWQMAEAHQTGQVVSPLGRVRQFDYVDERAERQAINAPVQGMASDIMLSACSIVAGFMPGCPAVPNTRIVGTVHDSMVVEVPADGWEEPVQRVLETMTTGVLPVMRALGCTLDVPLAAEATVGSRWGLDDVATVAYDPAVL